MDLSEVKHLPKVDHTPADLDDASRLLLSTAATIERKGLACGAFDELGRGCVIMTMAGIPGFNLALIDEALGRLRRHLGHGCVPTWSDKAAAEGRTSEVVSALRVVALGG